MTAVISTRARAPGKVIITGEHAVLYGQPALSGAIKRCSAVACHFTPSDSDQAKIVLKFPQAAWQSTQPIDDALAFAAAVDARHQAFLQNRIPHAEVLPQHGDLLIAAAGAACARLSIPATLPANADVVLNLETQLLLGGGMGSSASLVAAMYAALLDACQSYCHAQIKHERKLRDTASWQEQILTFVLATEQWQHGRSSGIDPHTCVHGGGVYLYDKVCQPRVLSDLNGAYVINTGTPDSSTGECVNHVAQGQRSTTFWSEFGKVSHEIIQSMDRQDIKQLVQSVQVNQWFLTKLGVVPQKVQEFVVRVESKGGAAKISGAGSIKGDAGGLVWMLGVPRADVASLCQVFDYEFWPLEWHHSGVEFDA